MGANQKIHPPSAHVFALQTDVSVMLSNPPLDYFPPQEVSEFQYISTSLESCRMDTEM